MQRILEAEFLPVQTLRPLRAFGITEYPAIHILGFNDEYPVLRHDDVIDLGRPVRSLERDVVQGKVDGLIEQQLLCKRPERFTQPSLEKRFQ